MEKLENYYIENDGEYIPLSHKIKITGKFSIEKEQEKITLDDIWYGALGQTWAIFKGQEYKLLTVYIRNPKNKESFIPANNRERSCQVWKTCKDNTLKYDHSY